MHEGGGCCAGSVTLCNRTLEYTSILTFFEKVKSYDPLIDAKLNAKTHLQKPFVVFSSRFVCSWLQSLEKVLR
jgi:hypothetical protein